MPDRIRQAVAAQRELIEGVEMQGRVGRLIKRFASAQLYTAPASRLPRLHRALVSAVKREWLPQAKALGEASAKPILDAMAGVSLVRTGRMPDGRTIYGAEGLEYVRARSSTVTRQATVLVDVRKVDAAWRRGLSDVYVARGGTGKGAIAGRYERFKEWMRGGKPIEMPVMGIHNPTRPEIMSVGFDNGRHRFAVLRDRGYKTMPVNVDQSQAAATKRLFSPSRRGASLGTKGTELRGRALARFSKYSHANSRVLYAALDKEFSFLHGDIRGAFLRGQRDGATRKALVDALVNADRGELDRLEVVRQEIAKRNRQLQRAEARLGKASEAQRPRAQRAIRQARKLRAKAKAKIRTARTFYTRFEVAIQGHIRDTIRRECQQAQFEAFRDQVGERAPFTWVTCNGTDACPSCDDRHGVTQTAQDWQGDGPGEGGTYCGSACMCQLVPEDYAASNQGLKEPVKVGPPPDTHRPTPPPE